jgi:hypothetical protein
MVAQAFYRLAHASQEPKHFPRGFVEKVRDRAAVKPMKRKTTTS